MIYRTSQQLTVGSVTAKETAKAALDFVTEQLDRRPVVDVVYSHYHIDRCGGVPGVVEEAEGEAAKVSIIAPVGFTEPSVVENVYACNVMSRRPFFQYSVLLPRSPFGHVDQSIAKNTAAGNAGPASTPDACSPMQKPRCTYFV